MWYLYVYLTKTHTIGVFYFGEWGQINLKHTCTFHILSVPHRYFFKEHSFPQNNWLFLSSIYILAPFRPILSSLVHLYFLETKTHTIQHSVHSGATLYCLLKRRERFSAMAIEVMITTAGNKWRCVKMYAHGHWADSLKHLFLLIFYFLLQNVKGRKVVSYINGLIASIPHIYTSTTMKNHNKRPASERSVIYYWEA